MGKYQKRQRDDAGRPRVQERETVVKCCLGKYLHQPKELRPLIDDLVLHVSRAVHRGSRLFNHYLIWCLRRGRELPDLSTQALYVRFFVLGAEGNNSKAQPQIDEFYKDVKELYPPPDKRISGDSTAFQYAARQYQVNMHTYITHTLLGRQAAHIRHWLHKNGHARELERPVRRIINGWNLPERPALPEDVLKFAEDERAALGCGEDKVGEAWAAANPHAALRYLDHLLRAAEASKDNKGAKEASPRLFSLAPLCAIRRHFLRIDTRLLHSLMKRAGLVSCDEKTFREMAEHHWGSTFNTQRLGSGTKRFSGLVDTDGVALCVHFKQVRPEGEGRSKQGGTRSKPSSGASSSGASSSLSNGQRVVAIDPGRATLVEAVEVVGNTTKRYRLTRKQYYHDSPFTRNAKAQRRRDAPMRPHLEALAATSPKTASLERFEAHVRELAPRLEALWAHYASRRAAAMRLDNYIHGRKTLDRFFAKLRGPSDQPPPTVAYGAAKFASTGRGELAAPTSKVYVRCRVHCPDTVLVDEFRTTKCCRDCGAELLAVRRWHGRGCNRRRVTVRGLKRCGSTACSLRRLKDRDLNAALNILDAYVGERGGGGGRPAHLCRPAR